MEAMPYPRPEPERTETRPNAASRTATGCCAPFDPAPWQDREITWDHKPFLKEHVHSVLHVPLDMNRKMARAMQLIEEAHAKPEQGLMLSDERSAWGADLYIDVTGPVPGAEIALLSGTFLTRVYEGPYRDVPKWAADMRARVEAMGRPVKKLYFAYTTCPRCAKAYGKNYVVLFAEVEPRKAPA